MHSEWKKHYSDHMISKQKSQEKMQQMEYQF